MALNSARTVDRREDAQRERQRVLRRGAPKAAESLTQSFVATAGKGAPRVGTVDGKPVATTYIPYELPLPLNNDKNRLDPFSLRNKSVPRTEDGAIDVGTWARNRRVALQHLQRGTPGDEDGNARLARITVGGKDYIDVDKAGRMAEDTRRRNEAARRTAAVMKMSGVYGRPVLDYMSGVGEKSRFKGGVAVEITPENRQRLYDRGYGKLRDRVSTLRDQSASFGNQLAEAKKTYKGPRGFEEFVERGGEQFGYQKEFDAYMKGVNLKVQAALRMRNKSEAARLMQVAEGRRVQMQEMAQKRAQKAWSGSAEERLWRAQQSLEQSLASQQASAMEGISDALKTNAQLARQFGVDVRNLYDQPASQQAPQPTSQQAPQPASQQAPQPASQQAPQPASWQFPLANPPGGMEKVIPYDEVGPFNWAATWDRLSARPKFDHG